MRVQTCPSCGARYNVERVPPGSTFECRRCAEVLTVGEAVLPPNRFSIGLLLAGVLALGALLLWANPAFGFGHQRWPWELLRGETDTAVKATIVVWALAGVWALFSALGIAVRTRSVLTAALAGVLLVVCSPDGGFVVGGLQGSLAIPLALAMAALAGGLLVHDRPGAQGVARGLAFGGGLLLVALFTLRFRGGETPIQQMVATIGDWFDGTAPADPWRSVFPDWALLAAGVVGLLAGLGTRGRWVAWSGILLLLVFLLLPTGADVVEKGFEGSLTERLAEYGTHALVSSGLAVWWLAAAAVADLVRAGRGQA